MPLPAETSYSISWFGIFLCHDVIDAKYATLYGYRLQVQQNLATGMGLAQPAALAFPPSVASHWKPFSSIMAWLVLPLWIWITTWVSGVQLVYQVFPLFLLQGNAEEHYINDVITQVGNPISKYTTVLENSAINWRCQIKFRTYRTSVFLRFVMPALHTMYSYCRPNISNYITFSKLEFWIFWQGPVHNASA